MMRRRAGTSATAVVLSLALYAGPALAESEDCYWNVEGMPYSMPTPPEAEVTPKHETSGYGEGTPAGILMVLLLETRTDPWLTELCPSLAPKSLSRLRKAYQRARCTPASSVGRMVEGLASGGSFTIGDFRSRARKRRQHPATVAALCEDIADIPLECFDYQSDGGDLSWLRRNDPHCEAWLPDIEAVRTGIQGLYSKVDDEAPRRELRD